MIKSSKKAYNLIIPLVRLLTLEYEKKFTSDEEVNKASVESPQKAQLTDTKHVGPSQ
jgi:hypothetical protein